MKKFYLYLAFILYVTGVAVIIDWFFFWENNYNGSFKELKRNYINHFPDLLQAFFNSRLSAVFFMVSFIFAGIILIKQKHFVYKIIGVTSLIFALWNLFTIM